LSLKLKNNQKKKKKKALIKENERRVLVGTGFDARVFLGEGVERRDNLLGAMVFKIRRGDIFRFLGFFLGFIELGFKFNDGRSTNSFYGSMFLW
jgi:hypothetical protein